MAPQHIIIIGAGIVGASIAHRLSMAGAQITIIDRAQAPGLGVSAASFGWITCAAGDPGIPDDVYRQRLQAIDDYTLLDREFGGRLCAPLRGAMVWGASEAETRDWAHRHAEKGSQVRLVNGVEITELEPMIAEPPALAACFSREKAVDVGHACAMLVRAARDRGAELILGQKALGLEAKGGRISGVRLNRQTVAADCVIVAAGAASADIVSNFMPDHGITMSPSALVTLSVDAGRLNHVIDGGGIEIRSLGNGDLIAACCVENCHDAQVGEVLAENVLARVQQLFPGIKNPAVDNVRIGQRPFVAEGRPLVSAAPYLEGLYLAVAHPGVILAPEISRQLAGMLTR